MMADRRSLRGRIQGWLVNRYPAQQSIKLTQKRIYILPTLAGCAYLLVVLLILLLAVNYQNNLAYAVCFTLLSLFITAILHTYANLSGLETTALLTEPVFAGDEAFFCYRLSSYRDLVQLSLGFEKEARAILDIAADKSAYVEIPCLCPRRGWQQATLLHVSSLYPLGLFRVWSWLRFEQSVLVYPKPVAGGEINALIGYEQHNNLVGAHGDDELQALKSYYPGATKSSIAWKVYAKGHGLQVKEHQGHAGAEVWLDWDIWPELSVEARLSRICYWTVLLSEAGSRFGVRLPNMEIEPATGPEHKNRVLKQLALFGRGAADD